MLGKAFLQESMTNKKSHDLDLSQAAWRVFCEARQRVPYGGIFGENRFLKEEGGEEAGVGSASLSTQGSGWVKPRIQDGMGWLQTASKEFGLSYARMG
jgi:hypothetical protein